MRIEGSLPKINGQFVQQVVKGTAVLFSAVSSVFAAVAQIESRKGEAELSTRRFSSSPELIAGLPSQFAIPNHHFSYSFSPTSFFSDPESVGLTVDAVEKDQLTLPDWLRFEKSGANLVGELDLPGSTLRLRAEGNIAYVIDSPFLQIIDISTPSFPSLISSYTVPGAAKDLDLVGNLAYVAARDAGLQILDVSDPFSPTLIGNSTTPANAIAVHVVDNRAYIADFGVGLQILDVSDPSSPTPIGSYPFTGPLNDVYVDNNMAYFVDNIVMRIIDVSNPASPTFVSSHTTSAFTKGVQVVGNFAYLISSVLNIVDISTPSSPVSLGFSSLPSSGTVGQETEVYVIDNLAYIPNHSGLAVVDVSNSSFPVLIAAYETPGNAVGVYAIGEMAFVADSNFGLKLIELESTFFGIPDQTDTGNYEIEIIAKNSDQNQASLTFSLRVQAPPSVTGPLPNQLANINAPFSHFMNQSAFPDPNGDPVFFSAKLSDENPLPSWLSFAPIGIFSGTPKEADKGNYTIEVSAFDGIVPTRATTTFSLIVEHFPELLNPVSNQAADIDTFYSFKVPQETFADADDSDILTYTSSTLPLWLTFNQSAVEFYGTPTESDAGTEFIELQASDFAGAAVSTSFQLVVKNFPDLQNPTPDQLATVGYPYIFALPVNTFISHDASSLSYRATKSDGSLLPNWLEFTGIRQEFQGTPLPTDKAELSLKLIAEDPNGGWAEDSFALNIVDALSEENSRVGGTFTYDIPSDMISNPQGAITYTVKLGNGSPLPTWLTFDPQTNKISGTTPQNSEKNYNILITANDGVQEPVLGAVFLKIEQNAEPQVANAISNQVAHVGQTFRFVVSDNTFTDPNGDSLVLSATKANGRSLPGWLSFADRTLVGKPGPSHTGAFSDKTIPLKICSSDGDQEACSIFDLNVQGVSTEEKTLSVVGPTLSLAALGIGWMKKRGVVLNPLNREKYDKGTITVPLNEHFTYSFQAEKSKIVQVSAYLGKETLFGLPIPPGKWTEWLIFDKPIAGGTLLPNWLNYNEAKNEILNTRFPRSEDRGIYTIRAYGSGDVILEEIKLNVGVMAQSGTEMSPIKKIFI